MKKIVLLTDMKDVAIAEVQLRTLKKIDDSINFVTTTTENFDIVHGMFLGRLLLDSMDSGDMMIVVLDPREIGVPRETLAIRLINGVCLFGPNNGVFAWIIKDFEIDQVVLIPTNDESKLHPTFNGKYRYAIAANNILTNNKSFEEIGEIFDVKKLVNRKVPDGTIVHIDNYGNLKLSYPYMNYEFGIQLQVLVGNKPHAATFSREFDDVRVGELLVYPGSSLHGLPEIAINNGNAADYLGVRIGDIIKIVEN